jgi:hypothetical protein
MTISAHIPRNPQGIILVNLNKFCKEQDLEAWTVKLQSSACNICIMSIYRAPSGNFLLFLSGLGAILMALFNNNTELILCGDINVNYLEDSNRKKHWIPYDLLISLVRYIFLPEFRITQSLQSIIFSLILTETNYIISSLINGMSDHDGQILYINNSNLQIHNNYTQSRKKFSKSSMNEFLTQLSYESWDSAFTDRDVDTMFNAFHNTYLRIFYSNFPKVQVKTNTKSNPWMTRGIKISCCNKREIYITLRNRKDPNLIWYYKTYCKILSNIIRAAKKNSIIIV